MTAVASLIVDKHPLLLGDLLLSWQKAAGIEVILPAVNVQIGPNAQRGPKGLHQKLVLVSDEIVLGWAGTHTTALDVVSELKYRCEHEELTLAGAKDYLRRLPRSTWDELELTGFILEKESEQIKQFQAGGRTITLPGCGEIDLLGSGGFELEKYFQVNPFRPVTKGATANPAVEAVRYGMGAIGNFLSMEFFGASNLANRFGGGYEIATLSYDKFVKLDNVVYAFWDATVDRNTSTVSVANLPYCAFKYEYYGDLLVIRSVRLGGDGSIEEDGAVFPIPPAYRYLEEEEKSSPPIPSMNGNWICNYIHLFVAHDDLDTLTVVEHKTAAPSLVFEEHLRQVKKVTVSEKLRKGIQSHSEQHIFGEASTD